MNKTEQALETAQALFLAHKKKCKQCEKFIYGKYGTLSNLCQQGTAAYKALLTEEDNYLKIYRVAP